MHQIVTFFKLLLSCIYLSACFRYHTNTEMISDFQEMQSLRDERGKYCFELSLKFNGSFTSKPLPLMLTEYGRCLEEGYQVVSRSSEKREIVLSDPEKALSMYRAAAQCSEPEAIQILKSRGEVVPPFSGREEGEYYLPLSLTREQDCGFHQDLTGWGYLFIAPIAIPVGAIILVGAILAPVACALTFPFHRNRCM